MQTKKNFRFLQNFLISIIFVFCLSFSVQASDSVSVSVHGKFDYTKAYEVLKYTNQMRREAGLPALSMDADLLQAAMQRAAEISLIFSHDRPNGTSCFTVSPKAYGENIAAGQTSAKSVSNSWKKSPGHYKNIINSDYTSIGIGCFYQNNVLCWVQLFGINPAKRAVKPSNVSRTVTVAVNDYIFANYAFVYSNSKSLGAGNTIDRGKSASISLGFQCSLNDNFSTFSYGGKVPTFSWRDFKLSSSNPSVLSVNSSGLLTARKKGSAKITIEHRTKPSMRTEYLFTVKDSNSRSVIFQANGGSFSKTSSVTSKHTLVTYKKKYGTLPTPVRKGYLFKGWYTKKNGGSRIKSTSTVKISKGKSQTLYARWSKITVKRAAVSKLTSRTRTTAAVTWKKLSDVSGYELEVSSSAKFTSGTTKRIVFRGNTKRSYTLQKLKSGQKYYVRIRAFRTDTFGNRIYGKYSTAKSVKIK